MRPLQLELEGFMSFRERTLIDFCDTDLFVLVGPMGAGKSSIIDAMGFALYGSIARFENLNLVLPVISQGCNETRVRLDFRLVNQDYSVVRVVRRGKTGGTAAAEARLVAGGVLLAGDPAEVTRKVTELLGLNFEQFTKCVVLPQGAFAELLHARPAERQDLLVRLLDIGMYGSIGARAGRRRDRAKDNAQLLEKRLIEELDNVTPEAYQEQDQWVQAFRELCERFQGEEETLSGLTKTAEASGREAGEAEMTLNRLQAIVMPPGIGDLGERLRRLNEAYERARCATQEASNALTAVLEQREALGERAAIEAVVALYKQASTRREAIDAATRQLDELRTQLTQAERLMEKARADHDAAVQERDRLERTHSAYHASRGLRAGDLCPVCGEKLTTAPVLEEPAGLEEAERAARLTAKEVSAREGQIKSARDVCSRAEIALEAEQKALSEDEARLEHEPSPEACRDLLKRIDDADSALTAARAQERQCRAALEGADTARQAVQQEEAQALSAFNAARDPVAGLGAPAAESGIEEGWLALCAWAQQRGAEQQARLDEARKAEEGVGAQIEELRRAQEWACEAAGLALRGKAPRDAALEARVRAEGELKSIDEKLAERTGVERDHAEYVEASRVAGLLWTHLKADHFERWYLMEAMTRLVRGATERLQELSNDQYALALNKQATDFVVVDKINANEERPVRTLSGGETFLASLALALALGDEVASLAAQGAARLDALFLDEGFGSLDSNTLDTVASTIEELGARGRMVGIVTHVPELAGRIPVQFHVSKTGRSSQVERVEQS